MATITDVAARAGVSMKTVSRVLNGEAHVRDALRERVHAAVADLGYRPSLAARQLAGNRSFVIAYPFGNPSNNYIAEVLIGAASAARDRGYHLVSEPIEADDDAGRLLAHLFTTLRPDGVVITPPLGDVPAVIDQIAQAGIPLVRIAGEPGGYGESLVLRDREISAEMVRHLYDLGHRRIAFIKPHPGHRLAQERYRGYLDALAMLGLPIDEALIRPGLFDVASGIRAAEELLALKHPPSAIFAANDDMALGALQVAHRRGVRVPGDVAIAGFDDTLAGMLTWPPLTTVRQPIRALGTAAILSLLGEPHDATALRYELIVRASTRAGT